MELADGGTLFLDEIGDMPLALQAKLLRFLQDRVIERVGGREEIRVDVRIVCATNQDLNSLIAGQRFRQDLYYRIGEISIVVPPLRERGTGTLVLAHAILRRLCAAEGRPKRGFTEEATAAISAYAWPGNVRELENKIRTAVIMSDAPVITAEDLGLGDSPGSDSRIQPQRSARSGREGSDSPGHGDRRWKYIACIGAAGSYPTHAL